MTQYRISENLTSRIPEWEKDIAFTLRVADCDPIHGPRALRECLQTIQRECQQLMQAMDDADNACERCGAPPAAQDASWDGGMLASTPGFCRACGARHGLQPITVRPITREEESDVSF